MVRKKKWRKVWAWLLKIRGTQLSLRLKLISGGIKQILRLKHLGKFTLFITLKFYLSNFPFSALIMVFQGISSVL